MPCVGCDKFPVLHNAQVASWFIDGSSHQIDIASVYTAIKIARLVAMHD